jgi:hypothetical protein
MVNSESMRVPEQMQLFANLFAMIAELLGEAPP